MTQLLFLWKLARAVNIFQRSHSRARLGTGSKLHVHDHMPEQKHWLVTFVNAAVCKGAVPADRLHGLWATVQSV